MKVLIVTPQLPYPPHQGTSLRNYHIIRGLAGANQISLLSYVDAGAAGEVPQHLASLCRRIVTVAAPVRSSGQRMLQMLTSKKPDMALRLYDPEMAAALLALLRDQEFDIVQLEGIELAWIMPLVRQYAPRTKLVFDAHNAETVLQIRSAAVDRGDVRRWPAAAYSRVQIGRLAQFEAWACESADWVTVVSEADRQALRKLVPQERQTFTVVPNCIDVAAYQGSARPSAAASELPDFDVIFSGKMDYRPNIDAVLWFGGEVWPKVLAQRPEATWVIAGQKPHARLEPLRRLPGVTITGWVHEMAPYLAASKVMLMPFRVGSGTRLKLIEGLAAGKAVVSTSVGVEGFPIKNGEQLLVSDSAETFAASVLTLIRNEQLRSRLGREGRKFAEQYDWRVVIPSLQAVYDQLIGEA